MFSTNSRSVKLKNSELALAALSDAGLPMGKGLKGTAIQAADLVDGHREKSLALLWNMMLEWQLPMLVNMAVLRSEIRRLKGLRPAQTSRAPPFPLSSSDAAEVAAAGNEQRKALLLEWVQLVCQRYGVAVENLGTSFSDGTVLCFLVHYYADRLLVPRAAIQMPVASNTEAEAICIERTRANFALVFAAMRELGGVPEMLSHEDVKDCGPDEKAVEAYVTFLCARLLDARAENRAALLIQVRTVRRQLSW